MFWVRVYGLLSTLMPKRMREELGMAMGRLVAVDCDKDGRYVGEFVRIKVGINVLQPLRRGLQFCLPTSEGGGLIRVLLQ